MFADQPHQRHALEVLHVAETVALGVVCTTLYEWLEQAGKLCGCPSGRRRPSLCNKVGPAPKSRPVAGDHSGSDTTIPIAD